MPSQTDMTPPTDDSLATVREACEEIISDGRVYYPESRYAGRNAAIARLALAMLERVPNTQFTLAKELATCAREIRGEE